MATSFVFILNCRRHGHAFNLPGYCIREIHGCPEKSASKCRQTCSLFDKGNGIYRWGRQRTPKLPSPSGDESGMLCRTARTKASLVQREVARLSGPRRSPASAGSLGRGGAAERLRFPPSRRKQRMRSLRRRGEECAPQNSTILPARAAPMRVNPNSFASATDSAVGMALLANTGTPARMTFSTISTGILPLV